MNITRQINKAEKTLVPILEPFFLSVYPEEKMVSHGLSHHRRVWGYAKEILSEGFIQADGQFIDKLLIACYMHDIGMSIDQGLRHGSHSSALCREFLQNNFTGFSDTADLLSAVESHDDKTYSLPGKGNDLLRILSVADDLDAFGYTGIFRYSEIYLLRKVSFADLGTKVLENASGRYANFLAEFGSSEKLVSIHSERYGQLVSFFSSFNTCCRTYDFSKEEHSGECGIVGIFSEIVGGKLSLSQATVNYASSPDAPVSKYFSSLKRELN